RAREAALPSRAVTLHCFRDQPSSSVESGQGFPALVEIWVEHDRLPRLLPADLAALDQRVGVARHGRRQERLKSAQVEDAEALLPEHVAQVDVGPTRGA